MDDEQLIENQLNKIGSSNDSSSNKFIETDAKNFNFTNFSDATKDEFKNSEFFIIKRAELLIASDNDLKFIENSINKNDQNLENDLNFKLSESFAIELNKDHLEKNESNNYNHSIFNKTQNGKLIFLK